jgi:hypothetical protein
MPPGGRCHGHSYDKPVGGSGIWIGLLLLQTEKNWLAQKKIPLMP